MLSLEYALYTGWFFKQSTFCFTSCLGYRIQLFENTVIDLMHAAISEVHNNCMNESRLKGAYQNGNSNVPSTSYLSSMKVRAV